MLFQISHDIHEPELVRIRNFKTCNIVQSNNWLIQDETPRIEVAQWLLQVGVNACSLMFQVVVGVNR